MVRTSTKENKNIYQEAREKMMEDGRPWSRERAADEIAEVEDGRFSYLNEDKLVKIENETVKIQPEDVLELSMAYNMPELRNHYCCHQCPIGEEDDSETSDLDTILEELEKISITVESIQLWCEKMKLIAKDEE